METYQTLYFFKSFLVHGCGKIMETTFWDVWDGEKCCDIFWREYFRIRLTTLSPGARQLLSDTHTLKLWGQPVFLSSLSVGCLTLPGNPRGRFTSLAMVIWLKYVQGSKALERINLFEFWIFFSLPLQLWTLSFLFEHFSPSPNKFWTILSLFP